MPVSIVDHHVDIIAVKVHFFLISPRQRIIGIEPLTGAYPVLSLFVAIDGIGIGRGGRMTDDSAVGIKAIDAVVLHGAPRHTVISLTNRSHRTANTDVLSRESPRGKLGLMLG